MAKKRLDLILFEHGFFDTKNSASVNILAHNVKINGETITKAGELKAENAQYKNKRDGIQTKISEIKGKMAEIREKYNEDVLKIEINSVVTYDRTGEYLELDYMFELTFKDLFILLINCTAIR